MLDCFILAHYTQPLKTKSSTATNHWQINRLLIKYKGLFSRVTCKYYHDRTLLELTLISCQRRK